MKGSAPSQGYVRQNYGTLPPKNYGTLPTKSTSVPVFMLRQPTGIELINQQIDTGTLLVPKINVNVLRDK